MSTTNPTAENGIATEPTLDGPFDEYDQYGRPTGAHYVRCSGCGLEVLVGDIGNLEHAKGCLTE